MTDYIQLLKSCNLKATPQRISVLKALDGQTHPTIDELFEQIRLEHPAISLATVYKNLNTLKDEGLVVEINTPTGKMRYDVFYMPHIHVVCANCGNIEDMPCDIAFDKYQKDIEEKVGRSIKRIDVLATVDSCSCC
ncbi:MAG: transcriptional repressor [Sulfurospirillaceae bacterium]|jgi:Fur family peroxide stress response transcriptional regulator|nr:transcriptional repressor [Sulfurospirillaceae bacterium]MCK9545472.1 transcriptional repressor [Sulfurospirillaceae bacterium]MDY0237433.1 Fur family transcriptional regulator [Campylobacterales bacterium]